MSNPILDAALIGIKIRFLVCLRTDVSYFLYCKRKTKEIGDICTEAIFETKPIKLRSLLYNNIRVLLSTTRNRN